MRKYDCPILNYRNQQQREHRARTKAHSLTTLVDILQHVAYGSSSLTFTYSLVSEHSPHFTRYFHDQRKRESMVTEETQTLAEYHSRVKQKDAGALGLAPFQLLNSPLHLRLLLHIMRMDR